MSIFFPQWTLDIHVYLSLDQIQFFSANFFLYIFKATGCGKTLMDYKFFWNLHV